MSKTYILQKDFGKVKKGEEIKWNPGYQQYMSWKWEHNHSECLFFTQAEIDRNPDWFKEITPEENKSNDSFQWDDGKVWEFSIWNRESENQCGSLSASIRKFVDLHTPKPQAENKPAPQPQKEEPLFTTEDGVIVKDPERMIFYISDMRIRERKAKNAVDLRNKRFYEKEKAEQYVLMNKKCFSVNEIIETLDLFPAEEDKVIALAKQKQTHQ